MGRLLTQKKYNLPSFFADFKVSDDFVWVNWSTTPVYLAQIFAAYEAVGCVSCHFEAVSSVKSICEIQIY